MNGGGRRSLAAGAAGYAAPALIGFAVAVVGLGADRADLRVPLSYSGDALLILPMVKATIETGTHWRTERLGAPGVQELYDFPVVDHLHFAAIWLIGRAVPDPVLVFNLYYLLTYPLTVLAGMAVLRRLELSVPAAAAGGLLYAFAPYHLGRGQEHYFLSAYFTVPLALLLAVRVCQGRLPFFRGDGAGVRFAPLTWPTPAAVLVAAVTASSGAYYAFFACALLLAAGLYGWAAGHGWRALASAASVIAAVVAFGVANHAPAVAYQYRYGHNSAAHTRLAEEADYYGLKMAQLVLPIRDHRVQELAAMSGRYDSPLRAAQSENRLSALGAVAAVGFLALLAAAILPVRKPGPVGPLAALTAAAVLVGTVGGFGSVFNYLVSPQVRCYNRISIFIAFLALAFVCWAIDRATATRLPVRWAAFAGLAAFGVWDQTPAGWLTDDTADPRADTAARFRADRAYYGEVEAVLGPGAAVFCLPFIEYPETVLFERMNGHDHARGYLHTATLRWSYGAMKGREADAWQREAASLPVPALLDRLVLGGFTGLYLNRNGYKPGEYERVTDDLSARLDPPMVHPAGDRVCYDLRPHRRHMIEADGPNEFERKAGELRDRVTVLWLGGFRTQVPVGREWKPRFCGDGGQAVFVNPTDRPRRFRAKMLLRSAGNFPADLQIDGDVWQDRLSLTADSREVQRDLLLPPGRTTVSFTCETPAGSVVSPPWNFQLLVAAFALEELSPGQP